MEMKKQPTDAAARNYFNVVYPAFKTAKFRLNAEEVKYIATRGEIMNSNEV